MDNMNNSGFPQFHLRRFGSKAARKDVAKIMEVHYIIGRCAVQSDYIIDSNSHIQSVSVSRCHARIVRQAENQHRLFDDSRNGVFVNNIKIKGSCVLQEGDKVTFGHPAGEKIKHGTWQRQPNSHHQFLFERCTCKNTEEEIKKELKLEFKTPICPGRQPDEISKMPKQHVSLESKTMSEENEGLSKDSLGAISKSVNHTVKFEEGTFAIPDTSNAPKSSALSKTDPHSCTSSAEICSFGRSANNILKELKELQNMLTSPSQKRLLACTPRIGAKTNRELFQSPCIDAAAQTHQLRSESISTCKNTALQPEINHFQVQGGTSVDTDAADLTNVRSPVIAASERTFGTMTSIVGEEVNPCHKHENEDESGAIEHSINVLPEKEVVEENIDQLDTVNTIQNRSDETTHNTCSSDNFLCRNSTQDKESLSKTDVGKIATTVQGTDIIATILESETCSSCAQTEEISVSDIQHAVTDNNKTQHVNVDEQDITDTAFKETCAYDVQMEVEPEHKVGGNKAASYDEVNNSTVVGHCTSKLPEGRGGPGTGTQGNDHLAVIQLEAVVVATNKNDKYVQNGVDSTKLMQNDHLPDEEDIPFEVETDKDSLQAVGVLKPSYGRRKDDSRKASCQDDYMEPNTGCFPSDVEMYGDSEPFDVQIEENNVENYIQDNWTADLKMKRSNSLEFDLEEMDADNDDGDKECFENGKVENEAEIDPPGLIHAETEVRKCLSNESVLEETYMDLSDGVSAASGKMVRNFTVADQEYERVNSSLNEEFRNNELHESIANSAVTGQGVTDTINIDRTGCLKRKLSNQGIEDAFPASKKVFLNNADEYKTDGVPPKEVQDKPKNAMAAFKSIVSNFFKIKNKKRKNFKLNSKFTKSTHSSVYLGDKEGNYRKFVLNVPKPGNQMQVSDEDIELIYDRKKQVKATKLQNIQSTFNSGFQMQDCLEDKYKFFDSDEKQSNNYNNLEHNVQENCKDGLSHKAQNKKHYIQDNIDKKIGAEARREHVMTPKPLINQYDNGMENTELNCAKVELVELISEKKKFGTDLGESLDNDGLNTELTCENVKLELDIDTGEVPLVSDDDEDIITTSFISVCRLSNINAESDNPIIIIDDSSEDECEFDETKQVDNKCIHAQTDIELSNKRTKVKYVGNQNGVDSDDGNSVKNENELESCDRLIGIKCDHGHPCTNTEMKYGNAIEGEECGTEQNEGQCDNEQNEVECDDEQSGKEINKYTELNCVNDTKVEFDNEQIDVECDKQSVIECDNEVKEGQCDNWQNERNVENESSVIVIEPSGIVIEADSELNCVNEAKREYDNEQNERKCENEQNEVECDIKDKQQKGDNEQNEVECDFVHYKVECDNQKTGHSKVNIYTELNCVHETEVEFDDEQIDQPKDVTISGDIQLAIVTECCQNQLANVDEADFGEQPAEVTKSGGHQLANITQYADQQTNVTEYAYDQEKVTQCGDQTTVESECDPQTVDGTECSDRTANPTECDDHVMDYGCQQADEKERSTQPAVVIECDDQPTVLTEFGDQTADVMECGDKSRNETLCWEQPSTIMECDDQKADVTVYTDHPADDTNCGDQPTDFKAFGNHSANEMICNRPVGVTDYNYQQAYVTEWDEQSANELVGDDQPMELMECDEKPVYETEQTAEVTVCDDKSANVMECGNQSANIYICNNQKANVMECGYQQADVQECGNQPANLMECDDQQAGETKCGNQPTNVIECGVQQVIETKIATADVADDQSAIVKECYDQPADVTKCCFPSVDDTECIELTADVTEYSNQSAKMIDCGNQSTNITECRAQPVIETKIGQQTADVADEQSAIVKGCYDQPADVTICGYQPVDGTECVELTADVTECSNHLTADVTECSNHLTNVTEHDNKSVDEKEYVDQTADATEFGDQSANVPERRGQPSDVTEYCNQSAYVIENGDQYADETILDDQQAKVIEYGYKLGSDQSADVKECKDKLANKTEFDSHQENVLECSYQQPNEIKLSDQPAVETECVEQSPDVKECGAKSANETVCVEQHTNVMECVDQKADEYSDQPADETKECHQANITESTDQQVKVMECESHDLTPDITEGDGQTADVTFCVDKPLVLGKTESDDPLGDETEYIDKPANGTESDDQTTAETESGDQSANEEECRDKLANKTEFGSQPENVLECSYQQANEIRLCNHPAVETECVEQSPYVKECVVKLASETVCVEQHTNVMECVDLKADEYSYQPVDETKVCHQANMTESTDQQVNVMEFESHDLTADITEGDGQTADVTFCVDKPLVLGKTESDDPLRDVTKYCDQTTAETEGDNQAANITECDYQTVSVKECRVQLANKMECGDQSADEKECESQTNVAEYNDPPADETESGDKPSFVTELGDQPSVVTEFDDQSANVMECGDKSEKEVVCVDQLTCIMKFGDEKADVTDNIDQPVDVTESGCNPANMTEYLDQQVNLMECEIHDLTADKTEGDGRMADVTFCGDKPIGETESDDPLGDVTEHCDKSATEYDDQLTAETEGDNQAANVTECDDHTVSVKECCVQLADEKESGDQSANEKECEIQTDLAEYNDPPADEKTSGDQPSVPDFDDQPTLVTESDVEPSVVTEFSDKSSNMMECGNEPEKEAVCVDQRTCFMECDDEKTDNSDQPADESKVCHQAEGTEYTGQQVNLMECESHDLTADINECDGHTVDVTFCDDKPLVLGKTENDDPLGEETEYIDKPANGTEYDDHPTAETESGDQSANEEEYESHTNVAEYKDPPVDETESGDPPSVVTEFSDQSEFVMEHGDTIFCGDKLIGKTEKDDSLGDVTEYCDKPANETDYDDQPTAETEGDNQAANVTGCVDHNVSVKECCVQLANGTESGDQSANKKECEIQTDLAECNDPTVDETESGDQPSVVAEYCDRPSVVTEFGDQSEFVMECGDTSEKEAVCVDQQLHIMESGVEKTDVTDNSDQLAEETKVCHQGKVTEYPDQQVNSMECDSHDLTADIKECDGHTVDVTFCGDKLLVLGKTESDDPLGDVTEYCDKLAAETEGDNQAANLTECDNQTVRVKKCCLQLANKTESGDQSANEKECEIQTNVAEYNDQPADEKKSGVQPSVDTEFGDQSEYVIECGDKSEIEAICVDQQTHIMECGDEKTDVAENIDQPADETKVCHQAKVTEYTDQQVKLMECESYDLTADIKECDGHTVDVTFCGDKPLVLGKTESDDPLGDVTEYCDKLAYETEGDNKAVNVTECDNQTVRVKKCCLQLANKTESGDQSANEKECESQTNVAECNDPPADETESGEQPSVVTEFSHQSADMMNCGEKSANETVCVDQHSSVLEYGEPKAVQTEYCDEPADETECGCHPEYADNPATVTEYGDNPATVTEYGDNPVTVSEHSDQPVSLMECESGDQKANVTEKEGQTVDVTECGEQPTAKTKCDNQTGYATEGWDLTASVKECGDVQPAKLDLDQMIFETDCDDQLSSVSECGNFPSDKTEHDDQLTDVTECCDQSADETESDYKFEDVTHCSDHQESGVTECDDQQADVTESGYHQAGVTENDDQLTDVTECDDQQADVTESGNQQAGVTENDDQLTDVTECDDQQADVTESGNQQAGVTENDDQLTDVTECSDTIVDVTESGYQQAGVTENDDQRTDFSECSDKTADVTESDYQQAGVTEYDDQLTDVTECSDKIADVTESDYQQASVTENDDQLTDVTESDYQHAGVTEYDYQLTDVTECSDKTADVTESDYQQAGVTEYDGQLTDVTDNDDQPADETECGEQENLAESDDVRKVMETSVFNRVIESSVYNTSIVRGSSADEDDSHSTMSCSTPKQDSLIPCSQMFPALKYIVSDEDSLMPCSQMFPALKYIDSDDETKSQVWPEADTDRKDLTRVVAVDQLSCDFSDYTSFSDLDIPMSDDDSDGESSVLTQKTVDFNLRETVEPNTSCDIMECGLADANIDSGKDSKPTIEDDDDDDDDFYPLDINDSGIGNAENNLEMNNQNTQDKKVMVKLETVEDSEVNLKRKRDETYDSSKCKRVRKRFSSYKLSMGSDTLTDEDNDDPHHLEKCEGQAELNGDDHRAPSLTECVDKQTTAVFKNPELVMASFQSRASISPATLSLEDGLSCTQLISSSTSLDVDLIPSSQVNCITEKLELKVLNQAIGTEKQNRAKELIEKLKARIAVKKERENQIEDPMPSTSRQEEQPSSESLSENQGRMELTLEVDIDSHIKRCESVICQMKTVFEQNSTLPRVQDWRNQLCTIEKKLNFPQTVIAVVGKTGDGKSSLLNALLDEKNVLPTSCIQACTAAVVEVVQNTEGNMYKAEIVFLERKEWFNEVNILLKDLTGSDGKLKSRQPDPASEAYASYWKIRAVYGKIDIFDNLIRHNTVTRWLGKTKVLESYQPEDLKKRVEKYIETQDSGGGDQFWPIVKCVKLRIPNCNVCSSGAALVDLPGVRDSNAARDKIAKEYMQNCTAVWVVSSIHRAIDDKTAKELLGENFRRQLLMDGQYGSVTFICTKTDIIEPSEVIRKLKLKDTTKVYKEALSKADADKKSKELQVTRCNKESGNLRRLLDGYEAEAKDIKDSLNELGVLLEPSALEMQDSQGFDALKESQEDLKLKEEEIEQTRIKLACLDVEQHEASKKVFELDNDIIKYRKKISEKCATARNEYSVKRIQSDYKAGLKEMKRRAGLLDEDYEEIDDSDDDDDNLGSTADNLQVFCCSATEYQKIQSLLDGSPQVFTSVEDTQIPALRRYVHRVTGVRRKQHLERLMRSLEGFVLGLKSYITESNHKDADRWRNTGSSIEGKVDKLSGILQPVIQQLSIDLDKAFDDNVRPKVEEGAAAAAKEANEICARWGIKNSKAATKLKNSESIPYPTYKAVVSRQGVYASQTFGCINFNEDLAEPMYRKMTIIWDRTFSGVVFEVLANAKKRLLGKLKEFLEDLGKTLYKLGLGKERLLRVGKQYLGSASTKLEDMIDQMKAYITTRQREISRIVTPHIQDSLSEPYGQAAREFGTGCFTKMKERMSKGIDSGRSKMFDEATEQLMTELLDMQKNVIQYTETVCLSLIQDLRDTLEPFWNSSGQVNPLTETLLPVLTDVCHYVRETLAMAGLETTQEQPVDGPSCSTSEDDETPAIDHTSQGTTTLYTRVTPASTRNSSEEDESMIRNSSGGHSHLLNSRDQDTTVLHSSVPLSHFSTLQQPCEVQSSVLKPLVLQSRVQQPNVLKSKVQQPLLLQHNVQQPLVLQHSAQQPLVLQHSVQQQRLLHSSDGRTNKQQCRSNATNSEHNSREQLNTPCYTHSFLQPRTVSKMIELLSRKKASGDKGNARQSLKLETTENQDVLPNQVQAVKVEAMTTPLYSHVIPASERKMDGMTLNLSDQTDVSLKDNSYLNLNDRPRKRLHSTNTTNIVRTFAQPVVQVKQEPTDPDRSKRARRTRIKDLGFIDLTEDD